MRDQRHSCNSPLPLELSRSHGPWAIWVRLVVAALSVILAVSPSPAKADTPSGYQEYFIPGGEEQLWDIFVDMDNFDVDQLDDQLDEDAGMHAVISVVAGADSTTVYYDHWEDGYDFTPGAPGTADETVVLNQGETHVFESSYIPTQRTGEIYECGADPAGSGSQPCYDGRDRLYTAGGAVTVNRASWTESSGATTLYALAWEVYPTKPWLTSYTVPVGEDLAADYGDFEKVYVIVQATEDGTTVEIDEPGESVQTDVVDRGGVTQRYEVDAGTTVSATAPVQVQFIVGTEGTRGHYELRGYTAVPQDLWDDEYYVPVGSFNEWNSDAYIYNPSATDDLTVTWEEAGDSGTFTVPPEGTLSYWDGRGQRLPEHGAVHLSGSHPFWGIGSVDTESHHADWGYSLVPVSYLTDDYTIGWAPSTLEKNERGSFVFVTAAEDDTTIFVDYDADGTTDEEYHIDRLDIQQIDDVNDYDMTGAHIWASHPVAVVWGEDPDTGGVGYNYLDLGYTTLPFPEAWMDLVLTMGKTADPAVVPAGVGERSSFTLGVRSYNTIDDVSVVDHLPDDWAYVDDSTTITFPDGSHSSGDQANPTVYDHTLTWDLNQTMSDQEVLTITFEAETTGVPTASYSVNEAQATGTHGGETFSTYDNAYVYISRLQVSKLSSAGGDVQPGETVTYTVMITNTGGIAHRRLVVSDTMPAGTSYVAGSARLEPTFYGDEFESSSYSNSDGTSGWSGTPWQEEGDDDLSSEGEVRILDGVLLFYGDSQSSVYAVERAVDLSNATRATFQFDYRVTGSLEDDDQLIVSVYDGSAWHTVDTLSTESSRVTSGPHDISQWANADTSVRFEATGFEGWLESVSIDSVQVMYTASVGPGGPPGFLTADDGCSLVPGETMTLTYQVTADDNPPEGLEAIVNTVSVTSDEVPGELRDGTRDLLPADATAVRLSAFSAEPRDGGMLVRWRTAQEIDNLGFNLYRASAPAGPYVRLNEALIPARNPGAILGASYTWLDGTAQRDAAYYKLEDVDAVGGRTFHGPVQPGTAVAPFGAGRLLPTVLRGP